MFIKVPRLRTGFGADEAGLLGLFFSAEPILANVFFFHEIKKNEEGIKVLGVIDGDTLVLEGKVRLRLRNIDAPELDL
ncbi:hypothetical protein MUP35_00310, partial [Patescibacteria group bacterium]|nr:hypothetical protein [Patescibacteria group bacterium]